MYMWNFNCFIIRIYLKAIPSSIDFLTIPPVNANTVKAFQKIEFEHIPSTSIRASNLCTVEIFGQLN